MSLSRRGLPLLFCLALLGLYLTPALAQGPTPLTYQFKQGDKLEYVIEHIGIMKVIDGVQVDFLSTASTIEVAWEVKEVDKEGRAKLACLLKRLRLEVTASEDPNQKSMLLLDTADETTTKDNELAKPFLVVLQHPMTLTMDRQGGLSELKVPDALQQLIKKMALKELEVEGVVVEMFHNLFHPTALVFSDDKLAKGASWKGKARHVQAPGLGFKITQQPEFTFLGPKDGGDPKVLEIAVKLLIEGNFDGKAKELGVKLTANKAKGTILFDSGAGRVVEADLAVDFVLAFNDGGAKSMHMRQLTTVKPAPKRK